MDLAEHEVNTEAMEKYQYQMNLLLQHIFRNDEEDLKKPDNWITSMQNLVGGKEYQHAHADQGRPQSFRDQTIFPFVAQHGFGRYPFQLWLLPNATNDIKYGFLKTFSARALVLMRGDFVHAGGVLTDPRCHMSFYPRPAAGLVHGHEDHYWLEENDDHEEGRKFVTSFLWQGPHFPFAYPFASYLKNTNDRVRTVLSYPPKITADILMKAKTTEAEETWRRVSAQQF